MTEITIDVSEEAYKGLLQIKCRGLLVPGSIRYEALKAYEAKKNEIKEKDWYAYPHLWDGHPYPSVNQCRVEGQNTDEAVKLPDHLQKSLNEWMDSL